MLGNFVHLYCSSPVSRKGYPVKTIDLRLDNGLMELILAVHSIPHYVTVDYEVSSIQVPSKRWNRRARSWDWTELANQQDEDTFERP